MNGKASLTTTIETSSDDLEAVLKLGTVKDPARAPRQKRLSF